MQKLHLQYWIFRILSLKSQTWKEHVWCNSYYLLFIITVHEFIFCIIIVTGKVVNLGDVMVCKYHTSLYLLESENLLNAKSIYKVFKIITKYLKYKYLK